MCLGAAASGACSSSWSRIPDVAGRKARIQENIAGPAKHAARENLRAVNRRDIPYGYLYPMPYDVNRKKGKQPTTYTACSIGRFSPAGNDTVPHARAPPIRRATAAVRCMYGCKCNPQQLLVLATHAIQCTYMHVYGATATLPRHCPQLLSCCTGSQSLHSHTHYMYDVRASARFQHVV